MIVKILKITALIVGITAGIISIIDFFITDRLVTKSVQRFFAPQIHIEQNISPEALRELRESSPDGTIRIEKGITILGREMDEHGCNITTGYSWNEDQQKCVRPWE